MAVIEETLKGHESGSLDRATTSSYTHDITISFLDVPPLIDRTFIDRALEIREALSTLCPEFPNGCCQMVSQVIARITGKDLASTFSPVLGVNHYWIYDRETDLYFDFTASQFSKFGVDVLVFRNLHSELGEHPTIITPAPETDDPFIKRMIKLAAGQTKHNNIPALLTPFFGCNKFDDVY